MDQAALIAYWAETADSDYETMMHLYGTGDYHWALFIGHLVLEKMLKAVFVCRRGIEVSVPRSHDLLLLSDKAGIETDTNQKDILDTITTFNINARYPDYKQTFYNKCTKEYTAERIREIDGVRIWLKKML